MAQLGCESRQLAVLNTAFVLTLFIGIEMLGAKGPYTPTSPPLSGLQMRKKNKDRDIKQVTQVCTAH